MGPASGRRTFSKPFTLRWGCSPLLLKSLKRAAAYSIILVLVCSVCTSVMGLTLCKHQRLCLDLGENNGESSPPGSFERADGKGGRESSMVPIRLTWRPAWESGTCRLAKCETPELRAPAVQGRFCRARLLHKGAGHIRLLWHPAARPVLARLVLRLATSSALTAHLNSQPCPHAFQVFIFADGILWPGSLVFLRYGNLDHLRGRDKYKTAPIGRKKSF